MSNNLDITSEKTKGMNESALKNLQSEISNLNSEQLKAYKKTINPDEMGFDGKEGI